MAPSMLPLIVGAGPVGLGAALFLARQGCRVRLVEERHQRAMQSKALAVNPRTLSILESTGVTERMLRLGRPIRGFQLRRPGEVIAALSFEGIHPKYPFMLALSQATTERLLAEALAEAGGAIERGLRMSECRNVDSGVEVVLEAADENGGRETVQAPWMLAADGAHSVARHQLGVDFPGSSLRNEWHLADVPLRTSLAGDQVHACLMDEGEFLALIPVVDGTEQDRAANPMWRLIGSHPDPPSRVALVVDAEPAGPPIWSSSFHVAHRVNAAFTVGNVHFAGDAAHIHSPLGARGMNLGLEDAYVFAELFCTGRLAEYDRLRRPVDCRVVGTVKFLSQVIAAESWLDRFIRKAVFPRAVHLPLVARRMIRTATGLDHELPEGMEVVMP